METVTDCECEYRLLPTPRWCAACDRYFTPIDTVGREGVALQTTCHTCAGIHCHACDQHAVGGPEYRGRQIRPGSGRDATKQLARLAIDRALAMARAVIVRENGAPPWTPAEALAAYDEAQEALAAL